MMLYLLKVGRYAKFIISLETCLKYLENKTCSLLQLQLTHITLS